MTDNINDDTFELLIGDEYDSVDEIIETNDVCTINLTDNIWEAAEVCAERRFWNDSLFHPVGESRRNLMDR